MSLAKEFIDQASELVAEMNREANNAIADVKAQQEEQLNRFDQDQDEAPLPPEEAADELPTNAQATDKVEA